MTSGSSGPEPQRWFLYVPVWATTKPPCTSGNSESGGGSSSSPGPSSSGLASSGSEVSGSSGGSGGASSGDRSSGAGSSAASGSGSSGGASGSGGGSGGSGGGGSGGGGSGGGGSGGGGSGGGPSLESSGNCFLHGTLVTLADGTLRPIERVRPGDLVRSVRLAGLEVDVLRRSQYEWLARGASVPADHVDAVIGSVRLGTHDGFVVINGRVKCTPEHPLLVRRGEDLGFASAELVEPGDSLALARGFEVVRSVVRVAERVETVSIHVPGTNVFLADGAWVHNDMPLPPTLLSSSSGSGSSGSGASGSSGGEKASGSSWGSP